MEEIMDSNFYLACRAIAEGNRELLSFAAVTFLLIAAAVIDIRERRIPDSLILAGVATGIILSLLEKDKGLLKGLLGGAAVGALLLLIYYLSKGGLGLGDVKLFGCTGIYLGFERTMSVMLIAAVLSGLFGLALVCINRKNRKSELPFAPFILAGALVEIIL
jgi:Flp pilus assembly protein protease CpaA